MFFIALFVGALSFAVILDLLVNNDWDIYLYLHKSFLQYLILSLPYVWIVCIAIFSWVAYYDFIHIRGWYRHRVYLVVLTSLLLSIGAGSILFYLGMGREVERVFSEKVPYYTLMRLDDKQMWCNPKEGLLGGLVTDVKNTDEFEIQDHMGRIWDVKKIPGQDGVREIEKGEMVKIIGRENEERRFEAKEIRRWKTRQEKIKNTAKVDEKEFSDGECNTSGDKCDEKNEESFEND